MTVRGLEIGRNEAWPQVPGVQSDFLPSFPGWVRVWDLDLPGSTYDVTEKLGNTDEVRLLLSLGRKLSRFPSKDNGARWAIIFKQMLF